MTTGNLHLYPVKGIKREEEIIRGNRWILPRILGMKTLQRKRDIK